MAGFGGTGFGGFGSSQNQNQTGTGFGGFGGSTAGTTGGFGATAGGGFGSNANTSGGGGLFGSSLGNTGNTGFAPFGGGNTTSAFGQNKPAFGTTTAAGNSVFGSSTATTGSTFGGGAGFGQPGSAFGSGSNTTPAFGQSNKPSFGQTGGLFPGGGGGFGQTAGATSTPGNVFGASGSSPFGGAQTNNGTGSIAFSAHTDKEGAGTNQTNSYQTITAMPAYTKWSTEELRTVDYAQGRKYGNQNGQAGAFGVNSGFGGFGDSKPTPFGASNTTTGFGGAQNTTSAFGNNNSGGGLFGAKPASGGMFGAPAASSAPSTGLFGSSSAASFGSNNTTVFGSNTPSAAFGQPQSKPAFGGFGAGAATTGTATGGGLFGQPAATGNAFGGGTTANNAFGGAQSNPSGGGFSFGQQNQQQQNQPGSTFGGFGANNQPQQKVGGLFGGGTSTSGGLFGAQQAQQQQTGGGLFGSNASTQQPGGGLFGSKPAATGGLFGNSTTSGAGGLFSNQQQQQQQPQTGGLFGASNAQQNNAGLFGNRAPAASTGLGGSLFGQNTSQQQPAGSGLFGASQQQQQQPALGNSLFSSLNQQTPQNQQNQPSHLYATLNDNPYNNIQLFSDLHTPTQSLGPLATPLSSSQSTRKQAVIPHYRMAPSASSRLITPQKRSGYGFTYSTYGSPNSAISNASPMGFGNSLLGGSTGRSIPKSLSTSNLRHAYTAQDSILAPGAFSGATRNGTGSMKKLNINRGLTARHSLFGTDAPAGSSVLAKKVSFENGLNSNGAAAVRAEPSGAISSSRTTRSSNHEQSRASERTGSTESTQTIGSNGKGMELAIVPENDAAVTVKDPYADQIQGAYWMQPNVDQLKAMSREQRANLVDFKVGRYGCGSIVFHKVDLTNTPIEQIAGGIVVFITRQATVYPKGSPQKKPPVGSGLNVPSTITLDNSWARSKRGRGPATEQNAKVLKKHVESLQRDQRTKFIAFDAATGQWTFKVEHYTTYGLVYGDNADDDDDDSVMAGTLPGAMETATPLQGEAVNDSAKPTPGSVLSSPEASIDDTFDFKKARGQAKNLIPGQFEDEGFEENEAMDSSMEEVEMLDDQSQGSAEVGDVSDVEHENGAPDYDMAGSFPLPTGSTLPQDFEVPAAVSGPVKPKSILKDASVLKLGTPSKADPLVLVHDWTEQLQYTASPRKQDRVALRDNQAPVQPAQKNGQDKDLYGNDDTKAFGTNLDIMKSLFAASDGKNATKVPEISSKKRPKTGTRTDILELPFHDLTKPSWGCDNSLVYGGPGNAPRLDTGVLINIKSALPGGHNDVKFAKLNGPSSAIPDTIAEQRVCTSVSAEDDAIPRARTTAEFNFIKFASATQANTRASEQESAVWQLASILFDDLQGSLPVGPSQEDIPLYQSRIRKDKLSDFWKKLVQTNVEVDAQNAKSSEEKAFIHLTGGNVPEACAALLSGQNFHLAQMVAQIGGDKTFRKAVERQLDDWRELNVLSEMNDSVRAIYGLLAGQTCNYPGKTGVAAEDKAASWPYSARFQLDWKRSFGLRLWYGILEDEDLAHAVRLFKTDFRENGEIASLVPWFHDDNDDVWSDPEPDSREDALWGLLKLYADDYVPEERPLTSLKSALAPENTSGNPMDPRLSFQLLHLLRAIGVGTTFDPRASEKENKIVNADDDIEATSAADRLALLYATSLTSQISSNSDSLPVACWVLLHISDAPTRTTMIRNLLDQHANILNPGEPLFTTLTTDLHIPPSWIYISKALYAQAVECSPVSEARWLIEAQQLHRAHAVLCHVIGPAAIIARDYDPLREILGALVATDIARKVDWAKGGGLYFDFVELADLEGGSRRSAHSRKQVAELVRKLSASLEAVAGEVRGGERGDMERIALQIMAEWVLDIGEREGVLANSSRVLRLPLSGNALLAHSKRLSLNYYRTVLAKS